MWCTQPFNPYPNANPYPNERPPPPEEPSQALIGTAATRLGVEYSFASNLLVCKLPVRWLAGMIAPSSRRSRSRGSVEVRFGAPALRRGQVLKEEK
jgi:hypothetical protein